MVGIYAFLDGVEGFLNVGRACALLLRTPILSQNKLLGWSFTGKFPRKAHFCSKGVLRKRCHMGIQHLKALEFQRPGMAFFKLLLKTTQPC